MPLTRGSAVTFFPLLWLAAAGALLLGTAGLSYVHQLREVRSEVESSFSSRNALVEKFVALNQDKLEVMALLLKQRYDAVPTARRDDLRPLAPNDEAPQAWELPLALSDGSVPVAAGAERGAGGVAMVTGRGALPLTPQQQREMAAAANMAPQIQSAFMHDPDVFRLYYVSVQGFLYVASAEGTEHLRFTTDLYQRGYWVAALPQANPMRRMVLYGPHRDPGGRGLVVTFAQPVYDRERFLGVVALDLGVDTLQRLTSVGSSAGDTLMLGAYNRLLSGQGDLKPGHVVRPPLSDKVIDWHEDAEHTLWLSSPIVKDDLWLVHRLPRAELYRAAARRSAGTWVILLLSGGLFVLALRLRRVLAVVTRLTITDPLTKVLNRRGFYEQAAALLALARRKRHLAALAVFDIGHFKRINDTYGHAVGDGVLRQLGEHLLAALRSGDLFCRWGGEEFVLLLVLDRAGQAQPVTERIRQQAQQTRVAPEGPAITLSVGLVLVAEDESLDSAVGRADELLYRAK